MEQVQPFDRPVPWRAAALIAIAGLLALGGFRLFAGHRTAERARPVAATGRVSKRHVLPLRSRSRVSVLVLNGNDIAHAAGYAATQLLARGYRHAYPTDASSTYARSVVLFRPGWEREAQRLARDAKIRTVTPLDARLPAVDSADQLVLILGAS